MYCTNKSTTQLVKYSGILQMPSMTIKIIPMYHGPVDSMRRFHPFFEFYFFN